LCENKAVAILAEVQRRAVIHSLPIPQPVAPVAVENLAPPHTYSSSKPLKIT